MKRKELRDNKNRFKVVRLYSVFFLLSLRTHVNFPVLKLLLFFSNQFFPSSLSGHAVTDVAVQFTNSVSMWISFLRKQCSLLRFRIVNSFIISVLKSPCQ